MPKSASSTSGTHVGEQIARIRRAANVSQTGLAEAVGVSGTYIGLIEAGRRRPSEDVLERCIYALDIAQPTAAKLRKARSATRPGSRL